MPRLDQHNKTQVVVASIGAAGVIVAAIIGAAVAAHGHSDTSTQGPSATATSTAPSSTDPLTSPSPTPTAEPSTTDPSPDPTLATDPTVAPSPNGPEFTVRSVTTGTLGYDWHGRDFDANPPTSGTPTSDKGIDFSTDLDDGTGVYVTLSENSQSMAKVPAGQMPVTAAQCKAIALGPNGGNGPNLPLHPGDTVCFTTPEGRVVSFTDLSNTLGADQIQFKATVWNDTAVANQ